MIKRIAVEPWVHLDTAEDLNNWSEQDGIEWNQNNRQSGKYQFYIKAFDFINANKVSGDYLEFGCHRVRTFRMALTEAKHQHIQNMKFYAFDSFEGLPPNKSEIHGVDEWQPHALTTSEDDFWKIINEHGLYQDKVKAFSGFYDVSLTPELKTELLTGDRKAAVICIDCDLYESSVPVFSFIEDFLQEGTVIYIDDWFAGYKGNPNKGVSKAFREFEEKSQYKFVQFLQVPWIGNSFIAYKD